MGFEFLTLEHKISNIVLVYKLDVKTFHWSLSQNSRILEKNMLQYPLILRQAALRFSGQHKINGHCKIGFFSQSYVILRQTSPKWPAFSQLQWFTTRMAYRLVLKTCKIYANLLSYFGLVDELWQRKACMIPLNIFIIRF